MIDPLDVLRRAEAELKRRRAFEKEAQMDPWLRGDPEIVARRANTLSRRLHADLREEKRNDDHGGRQTRAL
jgi:hypothetical protein